jgi:hypothetical protein
LLKRVFRRLDAGPVVPGLVAEHALASKRYGDHVHSWICRGLASPVRLDLPRVRVRSCDDEEPHQSRSCNAPLVIYNAHGTFIMLNQVHTPLFDASGLMASVLVYFC